MEIKSYKAEPSLSITDKQPLDHNNTTDSCARNSEDNSNIERKSATKKSLQDENKPKQTRPKTNERESVSKKAKTKETVTDRTKEQTLKDVEGAKMQELEAMIEQLDPNFQKKKKAAEELDFIFDPKGQSGDVPYHQDGNMEFYTQDNEKKRADIKTNPLVVEELNKVIDLYQFNTGGLLTKQEYIKMHMKIAKSMRKDLKEKGLMKLVEQDWKHDSKSKGIMEKEELFNSLFELGDVWTPDINVYQYVAFFQKLYKLLSGETDTLGSIPVVNDNPYNILS